MEVENLPVGSSNEVPFVPFEQIARQSESALKAEAAAQVKRPVGRPPGSKKTKPEQSSSEVSEKNESSQGGNLDQTDKQAADTFASELKPLLSDVIKAPFSVGAGYFSMPELDVTDEEAKTPTHYLTRYLSYVFPDLYEKGPKEFSLYAFVISTGILALRKLIVYAKRPRAVPVVQVIKNEETNEPAEVETVNPSLPNQLVPASALFRGRS